MLKPKALASATEERVEKRGAGDFETARFFEESFDNFMSELSEGLEEENSSRKVYQSTKKSSTN
jgi:hypothetical protein